MEVYFVPQTEGEPDSTTDAGHDAGLPLSERDRRYAQDVVGLLHGMGISLDRVLTSPLPAGRQTSQAIVTAWGDTPPPVTECPQLSPGGDPLELTRCIRDSGGQAVALVGHEADLSRYAARLIGGENALIDLTDGAVAAVTFRGQLGDGQGVLIWVIPSGRVEKEPIPQPPV